MSVTILPVLTTDTFGIWRTRTNSAFSAMESFVSLGDSESANANGDIVINGKVKANDYVQTDEIRPVSLADSKLLVKSDLEAEGEFTVDSNTANTAAKIILQNANTDTWQIATNANHDQLTITTASGADFILFDSANSTITTNGMSFVSDSIPNLDASKITSGTFTTARIPSLGASKITSGTFNLDRIPTIPASKVTQGSFDPGTFQFSGSLDVRGTAGVLFTVTNTIAASRDKVMMSLVGEGSSLEFVNSDTTGDYEIRSGDGGVRINDHWRGVQFVHRNPLDPNGLTALISSDSYPDEAPLEVNSRYDNTVQVTAHAPVYIRNNLTVETGSQIRGNGAVPPGAVQGFLRRRAPEGWLLLNGDTIPNGVGTVQSVNSDFSLLYAVLVQVYGDNGGNPIAMPNMFGRFGRAWDGGVLTPDIGRTQEASIGPHRHNYESATNGAQISLASDDNAAGMSFGVSNNPSGGGESTQTTLTGVNIGDETRPMNLTLLYCIKY